MGLLNVINVKLTQQYPRVRASIVVLLRALPVSFKSALPEPAEWADRKVRAWRHLLGRGPADWSLAEGLSYQVLCPQLSPRSFA